MSLSKPTDKLTPADWKKHPVWTFDLGNEGKPGRDETWMVPIKKLPVTDLRGSGCYANASLASSQPVTVVLWGIRLQNDPKEKALLENHARILSERNRPVSPKGLRYSIWVNKHWWVWHKDSFISLGDFKTRTSADLAQALNLTVEEVFPITYDISAFAIGSNEVIRGKIEGI